MVVNKTIIDSAWAKWILAIVAFLSLGWAIVQTFYPKNPKLNYEILSQTKLFNKASDLSSVKLLVDTMDVLEGNQNISFYVLKIQNIGNQHLRQSDYDEGLFGIRIKGGEIIQDVNIIDASTQHIENRYSEMSPAFSSNFVDIPRISLDKNDWYSISFAVIHNDSVSPAFVPVGKVIGQKLIAIGTSSAELDQLSFVEKFFFGSIWVNLARAFAFLLFWAALLIAVVSISVNVSDKIDSKKRERCLKQVALNSNIVGFVRDDYNQFGNEYIDMAAHYFGLGEKQLNSTYNNSKEYIYNTKNFLEENFDRYRTIYMDINILINKGYLIKEGDGVITIPRDVKDSVKQVKETIVKNRIEASRYYPMEMYDGVEMSDMFKDQ